MRSLPAFGLGIVFAVGGLFLFGWTLRKATAATDTAKPAAPVKKSELRAIEARQTETNKLRIAAAIMVAVGTSLMLVSR